VPGVGGGNIFRGIAGAARASTAQRRLYGHAGDGDERAGVQNALEKIGVDTRVQSAIPMSSVCEPYIRRRAMRHMEKGPHRDLRGRHRQSLFHTDTAAALRAAEMGCTPCSRAPASMAFTCRPKEGKDASRYDSVSFNRCWPMI
jgi:uridylate kinase